MIGKNARGYNGNEQRNEVNSIDLWKVFTRGIEIKAVTKALNDNEYEIYKTKQNCASYFSSFCNKCAG